VIFALSATPNLRVAESDAVDFVVRKAGHMAAFGILALLAWTALAYTGRRHAIVLSFALTVAYAATDEFHQSFTGGRHASPLDVGIDSAGAAIALLALVAWLRIRPRKSE
jgi:VanZ family protein